MTTLDLDAIRERSQKFEDLGTEISPSNYRIVAISARCAGDVPVLLAEIERLRAELDALYEKHAGSYMNGADQ